VFASDDGGGLGTRDTDMVLLLGAPATTAAAAAADAAALTDPDEPAATDTLAVCCGEHSLTTGSLETKQKQDNNYFRVLLPSIYVNKNIKRYF